MIRSRGRGTRIKVPKRAASQFFSYILMLLFSAMADQKNDCGSKLNDHLLLPLYTYNSNVGLLIN